MFNVYSISSHGAVVARLTVDQSVTCSNQVEETSSRVAQWKRAGLIIPMSHDRNMSLLFFVPVA